jgi:hypothetical protein
LIEILEIREGQMSNTAWQAFYYHAFDNSHPPARTELNEAPSEDEAAKIA